MGKGLWNLGKEMKKGCGSGERDGKRLVELEGWRWKQTTCGNWGRDGESLVDQGKMGEKACGAGGEKYGEKGLVELGEEDGKEACGVGTRCL